MYRSTKYAEAAPAATAQFGTKLAPGSPIVEVGPILWAVAATWLPGVDEAH